MAQTVCTVHRRTTATPPARATPLKTCSQRASDLVGLLFWYAYCGPLDCCSERNKHSTCIHITAGRPIKPVHARRDVHTHELAVKTLCELCETGLNDQLRTTEAAGSHGSRGLAWLYHCSCRRFVHSAVLTLSAPQQVGRVAA